MLRPNVLLHKGKKNKSEQQVERTAQTSDRTAFRLCARELPSDISVRRTLGSTSLSDIRVNRTLRANALLRPKPGLDIGHVYAFTVREPHSQVYVWPGFNEFPLDVEIVGLFFVPCWPFYFFGRSVISAVRLVRFFGRCNFQGFPAGVLFQQALRISVRFVFALGWCFRFPSNSVYPVV